MIDSILKKIQCFGIDFEALTSAARTRDVCQPVGFRRESRGSRLLYRRNRGNAPHHEFRRFEIAAPLSRRLE